MMSQERSLNAVRKGGVLPDWLLTLCAPCALAPCALVPCALVPCALALCALVPSAITPCVAGAHESSLARASQERQGTKTMLLGHPANWEARYLRNSLKRDGNQFVAFHLTDELSEEDYGAAVESILDELQSTDTVIIHQSKLRPEASLPLQVALADRVKSGDSKLIFLATGARDELAEPTALEPEFAALCPVTNYVRTEADDEFTPCFIEIQNHPVRFGSASLLRDLELRDETKVVTKIVVDEVSYPWIVRRELGEGTVTFVASDDLWRIRGNSTRAYETVWRTLIE